MSLSRNRMSDTEFASRSAPHLMSPPPRSCTGSVIQHSFSECPSHHNPADPVAAVCPLVSRVGTKGGGPGGGGGAWERARGQPRRPRRAAAEG